MNNNIINALNEMGVKSIKLDLQMSKIDIEMYTNKKTMGETYLELHTIMSKLINSIDYFSSKTEYTQNIEFKVNLNSAYISNIDDIFLSTYEYPFRRTNDLLSFSYNFDWAKVEFKLEDTKNV